MLSQHLDLPNTDTTLAIKKWFVKDALPASEIVKDVKIGQGYSSDVFVCQWNDIQVAIKEQKREDAIDDFIRELNILFKLPDTPERKYIIGFHGMIESNINCTLVFEYMQYGDLLNYRNQYPYIKARELHEIFIDVGCGLNYLHKNDILHCDIKPENVLVGLVDGKIKAKLCDLGFALTKAEVKLETKTRGTLEYAAPEILRKRLYSEKSDMYAFSCMLYPMYTGKLIYPNKTQSEILDLVSRNKKPVIPSTCPPIVANLISLGWQKNPAKRPSAMDAIEILKKDLVNYRV